METGVDSSQAILLDETPLPRMFIPGKIVHVYTHRGGKELSALFVLIFCEDKDQNSTL